MKPELLAPAGSPESLRAAVQNGAGAVYLGWGDFNARRSAKNFSDEEFAEALAYCHVRGVRVFLTLNTLLTDRELPRALETAAAACRMGATAGGASPEQLEAARVYAEAIGLAFQIRDDMLDVLGDAKRLGKATHVDGNKNTFVSLYGVEGCRERIEEENRKALDALRAFEDNAFLTELTARLASREF